MGAFLVLCAAVLATTAGDASVVREDSPARWCGIGINTLSAAGGDRRETRYDERDFALLESWGFNFTRLTLDYRRWIVDGDWNRIDDTALAEVDRGIALGRRHGLHVMLNFHRAPGHCSCRPYERTSAFADTNALAVAARHWAHFARRYRGIPGRDLSFNPFNEPPSWASDAAYARAVKTVVAAIRAEDPDRPVVVDGLDIAHKVPAGLLDEPGLGFSMHGYAADADGLFSAWESAFAAGKSVTLGEFGVTASVPRADQLARIERYLQLARERNVGWALWEIRGGYGVIASCRPDTAYEDLCGERFDRELLELLQRYSAGTDRPARLVAGGKGYNSWPMIRALGNRLVAVYSRGWGHDIFDIGRGVFARVSDDGGRTWSGESTVVNSRDFGEVETGTGLDGTGAMLLWVRAFQKGTGEKRHDLYRSVDGRAFVKIASPKLSPLPVQVTDVFAVPGKGLMALWFSGWLAGSEKAWGTLVSADNGLTWKQKTVEKATNRFDYPTEPSAAYLGGGRILVVARIEGPLDPKARQFQLTSTDFGETWTRRSTNIGDILYSTPSLVYDESTGLVSNYYYERGKGLLKRRVARASEIFDRPLDWPEPEVLAVGGKNPPDAGNSNAARIGNRHYVIYYSGAAPDTAVYVKEALAPVRSR